MILADTAFPYFDLATFLTILGTVAIQQFATWWRNLKHKKETKVKLETITKELSKNGGDSIKDTITKIDEKLDKCILDVSSLNSQVKNLMSSDRSRLEQILNVKEEAMYLANDKGDVTFVNYAMIELFGMNDKHLLKRKRFNCIETQGGKVQANDALLYSMEKKLDFCIRYDILQRKGDKVIRVEDSWEPKYDAAGNFIHYEGKIKPI